MLDEPVAREPGCVACRKRALLHRRKRGRDAGRDWSEYFGETASKSKERVLLAPDFKADRIEPSGEQKIAKRNAFPEPRGSQDERDRVLGRAGEALV